MAERKGLAGVQVHPLGLCESDDVGPGTRIWAWAHVLPGARIGADCNICDHAYVEGHARLGDRVTVKNAVLVFNGVETGDDVFLGPNVVFTNDLRPRAHVTKGPDALLPTVLEDGVTLGAGTVVVCGTRIGQHAFAAAGSVITRNVVPHSFVAGNPATHRGWVCVCGEPLQADLSCRCGRHFLADLGGGLRHAAGTRPATALHEAADGCGMTSPPGTALAGAPAAGIPGIPVPEGVA